MGAVGRNSKAVVFLSAASALALCVDVAQVPSRVVPFDHWAEGYWKVATAAEPRAQGRYIQSPGRQEMVRWLGSAGSGAWAPSWARELP